MALPFRLSETIRKLTQHVGKGMDMPFTVDPSR